VLRNEWDGVLELVLNRPDKLNALNIEMYDIIRRAVDDLRTRDELKVMLIRARGRYFCAGADLSEDQKFDYKESPRRARVWLRVEMKKGMHGIYEELERVEKPIVVAHHATCVGGGLELSLSCDFRLAAQSAAYAFPEIEFGMLPLSGGVSRLTRFCGPHWARWMIMAKKKISADQALMAGLVHQVIPDETFEEEVRAFCLELAAGPSEALAAAKLAIELCANVPSDEARQIERLTYSALTFTKERAGMTARRNSRFTENNK
jgi:enoyl-CoA hydratase/carnithine racemase